MLSVFFQQTKIDVLEARCECPPQVKGTKRDRSCRGTVVAHNFNPIADPGPDQTLSFIAPTKP